ncbi:hypothetical protein NPS53_09555 [Pseudomonas putida]|uniref:hypothetical protein n=1 Tax=Pseudomonas putida TaxID=303 RepID=UPI0023642787|nr:hypothetical protein [Pseudomonas putida]MDD2139823.1 hypothetical protein [Pseudomonas putida]HDS1721747.1 hypothetical protein [Pseudomonas putida]
MKNTFTVFTLLTLSALAGCDAPREKPSAAQAVVKSAGVERNCITTGPNSPIVTGENSVVVIDGKTYTAGQGADCAPASSSISTLGVSSPIVTGAGAKVTSSVVR